MKWMQILIKYFIRKTRQTNPDQDSKNVFKKYKTGQIQTHETRKRQVKKTSNEQNTRAGNIYPH